MLFRMYRKLLGCAGISAFLWLAMPMAAQAQQGCAPCATFGAPCAAGCCQTHHCPPAFKYCQEGPPRICWQCGCPHPICNPCDLPHWGFYETCWSRWPFPPDFTHCPTPTPGSVVQLHPDQRVLPPRGGMALPPPVAPNAMSIPNVDDVTIPRRPDALPPR